MDMHILYEYMNLLWIEKLKGSHITIISTKPNNCFIKKLEHEEYNRYICKEKKNVHWNLKIEGIQNDSRTELKELQIIYICSIGKNVFIDYTIKLL